LTAPKTIVFDVKDSRGLEIARQVVFARLKTDHTWKHLPVTPNTDFPSIEFAGFQAPERFTEFVLDIFWELIMQGVIAPGSSTQSPNLPWFHVTEYGRKVLDANEYVPHDPTHYLENLRKAISAPDATVMAYLAEALNCFTKGALVAATILLGVASERVFLLVCSSLQKALSDSTERDKFTKLLARNAMKPKLDWVQQKIEKIQATKQHPLPDNVNMMLSVIYDLVREQRNELGHPRDAPPQLQREEVFANLCIFPTYYKTAQTVTAYFDTNQV